MKQLFLTLLLPALLLAGCSKNDNPAPTPTPNGKVAVHFTSSATKVSGDDGTLWDGGEQIGIYMIGASGTLTANNIAGEAANREYTASAGASANFTPTGDDIYYPEDDSDVKFISYYPYSETVGADYTVPVSVADQSNLSAIDVLYSEAGTRYNSSTPTVALKFSHALTKLHFDITAGAGLTAADLAGMTLEITNQQTAGTLDLTTGNVTTTAGTPVSITASVSADGLTADAIVLPAQTTEGMQFVFTSADGKTTTIPVPQTAWTAGQYTYPATLNGEGGTVTPDYDVDLSSIFLAGEADFYGDYYNNSLGSWNIFLWDDEHQTHFLQIELNTALDATGDIPTGTYELSTASDPASYLPFTWLPGTTGSLDTGSGTAYGANDYTVYPLVSGTFDVAKSGDTYTLTFHFVDTDGTTYGGSYVGTLDIYDQSGGGDEDGSLIGTADVNLTDFFFVEMDYYGDAYGYPSNDYANWSLLLIDSSFSTLMQIELNTAKSATTAITPGTYTMMTSASQANFVAGTLVPGNGMWGCDFYPDLSADGAYWLNGGTLTVAQSGDDYTLDFDLTDAQGYHYTGSYTGPVDYYDNTQSSTGSHISAQHAALYQSLHNTTHKALRVKKHFAR